MAMTEWMGHQMLPDLANKRQTRALESRLHNIDAEVSQGLSIVQARGTLVEAELNSNAAILAMAATVEMAVAERMVQRAGSSTIAQTIAADRINRLIQANDRTLGRNGL